MLKFVVFIYILSIFIKCHKIHNTPQPLYNTVHYNTVLDITRISIGPLYYIFLHNYTFYSRYNTIWIANMEIGLDPNNSVIKRLWCMYKQIVMEARILHENENACSWIIPLLMQNSLKTHLGH